MTMKDIIIEEINYVDPIQLHLIYDLIMNLKSNKTAPNKIRNDAHLRVREALKTIRGSLSGDIISGREDRI